MNSKNRWVVSVLKDFINSIPKNQKYFCIGSVALLSFISENVYQRKIKDIDIICDINNFKDIKKPLLKKNYCQFTFVDKKFPFYKQLLKLAQLKYYRFEKNGKSLEIMTTDFGSVKNEISVEIYPGIKFTFPSSEIVNSSFEGINIKALSPETLYCIYNLGLKTWGRFNKENVIKRKADLEQLAKVIDNKKLYKITNNIFLSIGKIKLKVPVFLMK
jgi:hypothetical protein